MIYLILAKESKMLLDWRSDIMIKGKKKIEMLIKYIYMLYLVL